MAGYDFFYRNPNLTIQKVQGLPYAHSKGLNNEDAGKIFRIQSIMYNELWLLEEPIRISTADEIGLQLIFKLVKVISTKGKKDVYHAISR
jgi:hypothetical protein